MASDDPKTVGMSSLSAEGGERDTRAGIEPQSHEISPEDAGMIVTVENQDAITARNAVESPLLRLPAELRLRIFGFAVGGHIIDAPYQRRSRAPREYITGPRGYNILPFKGEGNGYDELPDNHDLISCGIAQPICRQIYNESFNYLFGENIFHLDSIDAGVNLFSDMSEVQLGAIREISISFTYGIWVIMRSKHGHAPPALASKLPNLKRIFVPSDMVVNGLPTRKVASEAPKLLPKVLGVTEDQLSGTGLGVEVVLLDVFDRTRRIQDAVHRFHI